MSEVDPSTSETRDRADYPPREVDELVSRMALPVDHEQIIAALTATANEHESLMRLRSIPLAFTPKFIEPLDGLRWIENGGHD